ncbi:hypothetical protein O3S80_50885 [Streptomyces sp. Lzd4kr]|nr:hypothetical protein [Streptomyces sp. Lzd4kr]
MTYTYTDPDRDELVVTPTTRYGEPALNIRTVRKDGRGSAAVDIPTHHLENVIDNLRTLRRQAVGAHPGIRPLKPTPTGPNTPALREQLTEAMRAHELSTDKDQADADGRMPCVCGTWREPSPMDGDEYDWDSHMADVVSAAILPTTRLLGELHRSAHEDVKRVTALYEQWVKAGPPPIGTSTARWWDARLVELRDAVLPPEERR